MILSESRIDLWRKAHIISRRRWSVTTNYDLPSQLDIALTHLRRTRMENDFPLNANIIQVLYDNVKNYF